MATKNPTRGQRIPVAKTTPTPIVKPESDTKTVAATKTRGGAKPKITQVKGDTSIPKTTKPATPKPEKKIEFKKCGCGCDKNIGPKSNYAMGHDARHASAVADLMVKNHLAGTVTEEVMAALLSLPTEALRNKALGIYDNRLAKVIAKMEREAKKAESK